MKDNLAAFAYGFSQLSHQQKLDLWESLGPEDKSKLQWVLIEYGAMKRGVPDSSLVKMLEFLDSIHTDPDEFSKQAVIVCVMVATGMITSEAFEVAIGDPEIVDSFMRMAEDHGLTVETVDLGEQEEGGPSDPDSLIH